MFYRRHETWKKFWDQIAGPNWPEFRPELDFDMLPSWVKEEFFQAGYIKNQDFLQKWKPNGVIGLNVFYRSEYDGGGTTFGQEYIDLIKKRYPERKFERCYEWCSGPGFIGFALLDHGLCQHITLSDIYDPSLLCADETAHYPYNYCDSMVKTYLLKDLALLPDHEQFDLVVANPPHADGFDVEDQWFANNNRLTSDINWEAHKNFFANIKDHLAPDGIILLQENHAGSTVETFRPWIEQAGLEITDTFNSPNWYKKNEDPDHWPKIEIYYIEIQHA
jgi:hypothetical protein